MNPSIGGARSIGVKPHAMQRHPEPNRIRDAAACRAQLSLNP